MSRLTDKMIMVSFSVYLYMKWPSLKNSNNWDLRFIANMYLISAVLKLQWTFHLINYIYKSFKTRNDWVSGELVQVVCTPFAWLLFSSMFFILLWKISNLLTVFVSFSHNAFEILNHLFWIMLTDSNTLIRGLWKESRSDWIRFYFIGLFMVFVTCIFMTTLRFYQTISTLKEMDWRSTLSNSIVSFVMNHRIFSLETSFSIIDYRSF